MLPTAAEQGPVSLQLQEPSYEVRGTYYDYTYVCLCVGLAQHTAVMVGPWHLAAYPACYCYCCPSSSQVLIR